MVDKRYNLERKNGFPGFNGGLQLLHLDRMRAEGSWWLSGPFLEAVKKVVVDP
jgi:hypothetical protein